jgi:hypothetical protein
MRPLSLLYTPPFRFHTFSYPVPRRGDRPLFVVIYHLPRLPVIARRVAVPSFNDDKLIAGDAGGSIRFLQFQESEGK